MTRDTNQETRERNADINADSKLSTVQKLRLGRGTARYDRVKHSMIKRRSSKTVWARKRVLKARPLAKSIIVTLLLINNTITHTHPVTQLWYDDFQLSEPSREFPTAWPWSVCGCMRWHVTSHPVPLCRGLPGGLIHDSVSGGSWQRTSVMPGVLKHLSQRTLLCGQFVS